MAEIKLTILVHEHWRNRFPAIVEECRRVGLTVESELVSIGVITGCIEEERMPGLVRVDGVSAVEPQRVQRGLGTGRE